MPKERECPCETISIKGTVQPDCWLGTNILLYYERGLEKNTNRTAVCLNRYLSYTLSHVGGYGTVPKPNPLIPYFPNTRALLYC